ncbi:RNA polymerase sigma factor [Corallococcus llansteffanensis]|nr:sigma factor [Corallococcus llansteffanensis]
MYRFGLRMCGSEEDAREVLQETLLAAFRNLHAFQGDAAVRQAISRILSA